MNNLRKYISKIINEAFIDADGNLSDFTPKKPHKKYITYPIKGVSTKFVVTDKPLYPFTGKVGSLTYFLPGYITVHKETPVVQVQFTYLIKFVKLADNIYELKDVNDAYNKFFNEDDEGITAEKDQEKNTKYIEMFRSYLLNNIENRNDNEVLTSLFNLLEDTGYTYVYYDSIGMERVHKRGKYLGYAKQTPYLMK